MMTKKTFTLSGVQKSLFLFPFSLFDNCNKIHQKIDLFKLNFHVMPNLHLVEPRSLCEGNRGIPMPGVVKTFLAGGRQNSK